MRVWRPGLPAGVWWVAGGVVAVELAVSARYGFHRDELYFLAAGRRPAWGFVDQPPLTPLLARAQELLLGTSPTAIRVLPALMIGAVAVLAALIARRLGGRSSAQVFAAVAAVGSGVVLALGHLLATASTSVLLWTVVLLLFVRLLDGGDPRGWLAVGATVGVGLLNKDLVAVLAVALLVGLLVGRRALLRSRWPWLGALLAVGIAAPNLVWQARHSWPQLEMAQALAARSEGRLAFLVQQGLLLSVVLAVPAAGGLWWLLRSTRWRPVAVVVIVVALTFLFLDGKAYYLAPTYPTLLAAGAVWLQGLGAGRRLAIPLGVTVMVSLVLSLPIVPPPLVRYVDVSGELAETVGWNEVVDQVDMAYRALPDRRNAVIFTANYGEAAAIEVLGASRGLPQPVSGHNNYGLWGPPTGLGPILGVGDVRDTLSLVCDDVEQVATIANPWDVPNEENGQPILLCLHPTRPLATVWEQVRHLN